MSTTHKIGGATIIVHARDGEHYPCSVEFQRGSDYAEIGLWWTDGELVDYDGVFELGVVVDVLRGLGFQVPSSFE